MDLTLRGPEGYGERFGVDDVTQTRQILERSARCGRRAGELSDHEVHDIVGVALVVNALKIPIPLLRLRIESEEPLAGEGVEKLNREERIAAGPRIYKLRQRRGPGRFAMQRVGDELSDMLELQRGKLDLADLRPRAAHRRKPTRQRMRDVDLVVAIGADQHQMAHVRLSQDILDEVKRCSVQPL